MKTMRNLQLHHQLPLHWVSRKNSHKPNICQQRDKSFTRGDNLKTHMRTHSGINLMLVGNALSASLNLVYWRDTQWREVLSLSAM